MSNRPRNFLLTFLLTFSVFAFSPAAAQTTKYLFVKGDFSKATCTPANFATCAVLIAADRSQVGTVQSVYFSDGHALVKYTVVGTESRPVQLLLGETHPDHSYSIDWLDPASALSERREVVTGDFSVFFPVPAKPPVPPPPPPPPVQTQFTESYVYAADGSGYRPLTVYELTKDSADVGFSPDPSFTPAWIVLTDGHTSRTFTFARQNPIVENDIVYEADEAYKVCAPPNSSSACNGDNLSAVPIDSSQASAVVSSIRDNLIFVQLTAPYGQEPTGLIISKKDNSTISILARRVNKPGSSQSLLDVTMSVVDQETVRRNYGARIASHYFAVKLSLANRTQKKLQFNKAAVWFDVDFRSIKGSDSHPVHDFKSNMTGDTWPRNVYEIPTKPCTSKPKNTDCKEQVFRNGIEQNERLSPDSFLTVLASFDYTTEHTDRVLRYVELFGSVLTTISSGGVVAQVHDTAFRDAASILTGTFLPGFRTVTLDASGIDRLRSNLVAQTMQETVQVPPSGFAYTIVLLPREGILGVENKELPVAIDRIIDVHIDPDVVNGVKDPPVPANHVKIGYTKDQVRQSLGEPQGVTTSASDGSSIFAYNSGPYQTISFNKDGAVTSFTERNLPDQLEGLATLADANKILSGKSVTATQLILRNQNTVLVDIPGVTKALQYDSSGKHIADYTLLYDLIRTAKTEEALEGILTKGVIAGTTAPKAPALPGKTATLTFDMPDVSGGTILVTFKSAPVTKDSPIDKITFQGTKPLSVK